MPATCLPPTLIFGAIFGLLLRLGNDFFYLFQEILKNESNRTLDKHKYSSQKVNVKLKQSCTKMLWKIRTHFQNIFLNELFMIQSSYFDAL